MWLGQTLVILKRVMYAHQIHGFNPLMDCKGPCGRSSDGETSRSSGPLGGSIINSTDAKKSSWPHLHRQGLMFSLLLVSAGYCLSASASASGNEQAVPPEAARSAVSDDSSCQSADLLLHNARAIPHKHICSRGASDIVPQMPIGSPDDFLILSGKMFGDIKGNA